jgi:hypothetical protein
VFSFRANRLRKVEGEPPQLIKGLKKEDVEDACPRFPLVQSMTNKVANSINPHQFKNRGAYGTAVHMGVKRMVDALGDPNFRTEVSLLKSRAVEVPYGAQNSTRIDIRERRDAEIVCVYDLKTGAAFLSVARFLEIYGNVLAVYKTATRIIVIEVRPT